MDTKKKWAAENPDKVKASRNAWKKNNPDKVRESRRKGMSRWRDRNPDIAKQRDKDRYPKEKERRISYQKKYWRTAKGRAKNMLSSAKRRAQKKGLPCTIEEAWILNRIEGGCCEVTGLQFEFGEYTRGPLSPSIDRIDAAKGYIPDNVRLVLWAINVGCSDWGLDEARRIWSLVK